MTNAALTTEVAVMALGQGLSVPAQLPRRGSGRCQRTRAKSAVRPG